MNRTKESLRPWAVVGARLDFYFGADNARNSKYEVRAVVDDEYLVVRRYVRRDNQGWSYALMHEAYLAAAYRDGNLIARNAG